MAPAPTQPSLVTLTFAREQLAETGTPLREDQRKRLLAIKVRAAQRPSSVARIERYRAVSGVS